MTIQFEAKKIAYRQTKDGVVVSFLINPHDVPDELATAELQTIYIARLQQTESGAWDEQASVSDAVQPVAAVSDGPTAAPQSGEGTAAPSRPRVAKPRRDWSELSPTEQAGIRCNDEQFRIWLSDDGCGTAEAARRVRDKCGVSSRSELNTDPVAAAKWRVLNRMFEAWLTTQQHGELIR